MAENKTQPTDASVAGYIASRANAQPMADVDVGVLEQIVAGSVAEVRRRYG